MDKTIRAGLNIALATQRARLAYLGSIPGRAIKSTRFFIRTSLLSRRYNINVTVLLQTA